MNNELYEKIINILKRFSEIDEKYYSIIALWIIGTYFHKDFYTYPYLFFNASKGSGKTRILSLVAYLSNNGKLTGDLTEANLFRNAKTTAFFIDEFENVSRKEKASLRLLLNSAYKKGIVIQRQKRNPQTGESHTEEFDLYTPIGLANINGMDDVLNDRCITVIMDKSFDSTIVRKIENWDTDPEIAETKKDLVSFSVMSIPLESVYGDSIVRSFSLIWNRMLDDIRLNNTITHNNTTTYQHQTTPNDIIEAEQALIYLDYEKLNVESTDELTNFIKTIYISSLGGRNLELFLPLCFMANLINQEALETLIKTAETIAENRKTDDIVENRDISLISYLSQLNSTNEWISNSYITNGFKDTCPEDEWIDSRWVGRALKRLNLILKSKRLSKGREFILNFDLIKSKANKFGIIKEIEKCYKCGSDAVQQIEDSITGKNLWICKSCMEELANPNLVG